MPRIPGLASSLGSFGPRSFGLAGALALAIGCLSLALGCASAPAPSSAPPDPDAEEAERIAALPSGEQGAVCADPAALAHDPPVPADPRCDDAALTGYDALLVLGPHPDDEVLAFGGLTAAYHALGKPVTVIVTTDGDAYCDACRLWKHGTVRGPSCDAADLSNLATPEVDSFGEVRRGESGPRRRRWARRRRSSSAIPTRGSPRPGATPPPASRTSRCAGRTSPCAPTARPAVAATARGPPPS